MKLIALSTYVMRQFVGEHETCMRRNCADLSKCNNNCLCVRTQHTSLIFLFPMFKDRFACHEALFHWTRNRSGQTHWEYVHTVCNTKRLISLEISGWNSRLLFFSRATVRLCALVTVTIGAKSIETVTCVFSLCSVSGPLTQPSS